jgi:hypothetical protein
VSGERNKYDLSPAVLRILTKTFWTAEGWRREPAWPEPAQMARAVQAGVMFAEPRVLDHDQWITGACRAAANVAAQEVADAFLASMTSRRLDLRSALASYAVARVLPEHPYTPDWAMGSCGICGIYVRKDGRIEPEDLNVLNFERFRWAGVRRTQIPYLAFDLEQFTLAPRLEPTGQDIALGQQIIDYLRQLPPNTTAAQASPGLTMLPGSKPEREVLVDILGICGILHAPDHPAYTDHYIPHTTADSVSLAPPRRYLFGHHPTWWWTAAGGISNRALHHFLPQLT